MGKAKALFMEHQDYQQFLFYWDCYCQATGDNKKPPGFEEWQGGGYTLPENFMGIAYEYELDQEFKNKVAE